MRILVVNSSDSGHHLEYKTMLSKAFLELGHEVINLNQINTQSNPDSKPVASLSKKKIYAFRNLINLILKHWEIRRKTLLRLQQIKDYIEKLNKELVRPDLIFFACLDAYISQRLTKRDVDEMLQIPFSGILFYPSDTKLMSWSWLRKGPFDPYQLLKSKWCKSLGVLDEDAIPFFSILINKPLCALPDIAAVPDRIQDNEFNTNIFHHAGGRFTIGIFGSLEPRKGVNEFLQMVLKLPPDKFFFVIGGRPHLKAYSEEDRTIFQKAISGHIENLFINDRWLTDEEFYSGLHACDLIFAAYPDWKFSSGIIGKAAAVRVPVLVNDGYVMAKRVQDFDIGFIKDPGKNIAEWVLENKDIIKSLKKAEKFQSSCTEYCERFGYDQWRKSLASLLKQ